MITSATSRRLKIVAVIVLVAVALALPFCLIPYGFWPVDEPYQILLSKDCTVNPVAFLSSFIIGAWGNVFGDDLATMRCLAAILSTATVAIAGFVLYSHTRRPLLSIAIASVANILLTFNQSQSYIIGWDVVSNFLIVASLAALFATINTSGKKAVRERKRKFVVIDLLLGKHYDPWMYRTRMYYLLTDNGYTHVQGGWKYVVYEPGR